VELDPRATLEIDADQIAREGDRGLDARRQHRSGILGVAAVRRRIDWIMVL
jgi:hypothetical protein